MKKSCLIVFLSLFTFLLLNSYTAVKNYSKKYNCSIKCKNGSCNASGSNSATCSCTSDGNPKCTGTIINLTADDSQKEFQNQFLSYLNENCKNEIEITYFNTQKQIIKYINSNEANLYLIELDKLEIIKQQLSVEFKASLDNWIETH